MFLLNLLENASLAGWLANAAGQLLIISILGFIAVKLLSGESAPVRSVTAAGGLVSMLLVFVMSAAFQVSSIAWYKADLSSLAAPRPVAATAIPTAATAIPAAAPVMETITPALTDSQPLPDIRMESDIPVKPAAVTAATAKPAINFQLKAGNCVNALGLLWAGGVIFMLLKLGYGLAFIRGFRFGLNRISDAKVDRLLKIAAETFKKQRLPELYTSPQVESPVTIGMTNPIVIIPEKLFATLSDNELKSILLHELAHIYHCDHVIGVFKRIIIAVNWWNPLAYIISAKHAVAREEVADNYVLRELAPKVYSECLAGLAEKICLISSYPAAAGMAGNYSTLERRVKDIMSKKRKLTMTTGTTFKLTAAAVCAMLALAVAGCRYGAADPAPPLTPEQIIARMAETYAKCKSYQDTGTVKTVFIQAEGNRTDEKPFSTAFVRPDQFRFEYKEKVDSFLKEKTCYIVWRKGAEVLTWFYATPGINKVESLSSGIAGATGVSGSSAHTIPALLLPEVGGRKLSDMKEAKLLEDAVFDNVNCYRVQGKFAVSHDNGKVVRKPTVVWIDKNSFLVRRIDTETVFTFSNFRTEDTTTYYPVINCDIPGKMLEFDPPGGSEAMNKVKPAEKAPSLSLDSPMGNSLSDEKEARRLSMIGYNLSVKQAAELEQKLSKNPDDVNTIALLLSYWNSISRGDNAARQKREKYILWMIEHHPDAVILDSPDTRLDSESKETANAAKKLWIEQAGKNLNNPQAIWNAANGVSGSDKTLAEQLFIKGQALDPENPKWADRLGNIYFCGNQPAKAFNEYKKVYSNAGTKDKVLAISRMTKSAADCGKLQEAGEYALEMQRLAKTYGDRNENYGKLFFNSNLALGRIALKRGNIDEAGKYLLEAGKTPISLKDMPDFTLTKDLLAAGKKEIVLQFFQSCSQVWDKTLCDEWVKQINEGKIPDFKYNPWAKPGVKEIKKDAVKAQETKPGNIADDKKNAAVASQMDKAKSRMAEDSKLYSKDELKKIDELAITVGTKWGTAEGKESLKTLLAKYPKANSTGNAVLAAGFVSKGDEATKYFQQAIDEFDDCFTERGVQVGAYARYLLGLLYLKKGENAKAAKLFEEIKTGYPDSIDFQWHSLVSAIAAYSHSEEARKKNLTESKIYSQEDKDKIAELYNTVVKKWDSAEAIESLKTMLAKYKNTSLTGWALLYAGQSNKGNGQINYLQQAINEFGDCSDDEIQIGPFARLLLARIYLKNGEKAQAMKLFEEIKTGYPDAIDSRKNFLVSIAALEDANLAPKKLPAATTFWDNLSLWYGLQDLQKRTGFLTEKEKEKADALVQEFTRDVYLVKFKPVNGFDPATAQEFRANFRKYSSLESQYDSVGGASMFVTTNVNDHLVGSFLTKEPQQMKADIEKNPSLQFLSSEKVTPEMFVKYAKLEQESLMDKWKTKGPKILEIIPPNGAKDVDPGLTKITVKFDRKMGNKSWSVCTVGVDNELPIDGKVYYDDSCTVFTIPLKKLQPNHSYATSLNAERFIGFISADGTPLYPYPYSFTTRDAPVADTMHGEVKKDAAKPENALSPETRSGSAPDSKNPAVASHMEKAWRRMAEDAKIYSQDELKEIESLYQVANKKWGTEDAKKSLMALIEKYKKANRAGCALLYLGQMSSDDEAIKYFQQAIDGYSDCFYGDGVQVGAYARYHLAWVYYRNAERAKCIKLFEEIKADYPNAIDHSGNRLTLLISRSFSNWQHEAKAISRMAEDSKVYSKDELATVEKLYNNIFNSGWRPEEARESLNTLIAKYSKANRTGCALLYFGQISKGDEQVKYLQQAVDNFNDCFYDDGVQIGPYARLLLARIYLKNGDKSQAMKLFNEIKAGYPDAIDQWKNGLSLIMNLTGVWGEEQNAGARRAASYWDNFNWWRSLRDLHEKTGVIDQKDQENADALMRNLIRNVYLVKFKPINGFDPSTPHEFLANFSKLSSLRSKTASIGGASFFRTTEANNQLIGSFLTEEPEQMKKDIEKNPSLQFLSSEKVTPEVFVKYIESKQESLMEKFKATGPKILETVPANGATNVDPGLTKITVKFDRKMRNKSWAVCTLDRDSQLPVDGNIYYDDSGTVFTIPVKLQPGHTYKTSLNYVDPSTGKRYISFVSTDGTPLYPYPYSFTTKAAPGADAKTGEVKKDAAKSEAAPVKATKSAFVEVHDLAMKGWKLSAAEAAGLEQKVSQSPDDITSLTVLLGYYSNKMFTDKIIMQKREKHLLWLIANHPEADILGIPDGQLYAKLENQEARKLWLEQLEKHPDNIKIVANAAKFFVIHEKDLAIKYYEQAIKLDPKNSSKWYLRVGDVYNLIGINKPEASKAAAAAFENSFNAYENAYSNSTAKEKESGYMLRKMVVAARKAGKLDKANEYNKMLVAAENSAAKEKGNSPAAKPAAAPGADAKPAEVKKDADKPEAVPAQKPESAITIATRLAQKKSKLSAPEAAGLEKKVAQNPEDLESRTMLLGYYFLAQTDKNIKQKREDHILWLIANHPEAGVLGSPYGRIFSKVENPEAKKLWLEQLEKHPDDIRILENAAHFVEVHDSDLSIKCFEKLIKLSPENSPMWYWWLGGIYNRNATYGHNGKAVDPKEAAADFEKAFHAYENAYAHSTAKEKQSGFVLRPLIVAARKAGKPDKAGEYIKILESAEASAAKEKGNSPAAKPAAATAGKTAQEAEKNRPSGIKQKLEKIIFPEVEFKDADIFTVIRYLNRNSKRYDPDYEGVTVVSGFTIKQAADFPKITLKQTKIPLGNLLDDLSRISGIKYRIDEGAIVISVNKPPEVEVRDLTMKGSKLSAAEAVELEQKLSQNPEDIKSITMLLGYYSLKSHTDKSVKQKKEQHVLWLIENHPEAEVLGIPDGQLYPRMDNYAEAKKLWLEQLEKYPENLKVLRNAAKSFVVADTDMAIKNFVQAVKLDPMNSGLWFDLANAYELKVTKLGYRDGKNHPEIARAMAEASELSLRAYENAAITAKEIIVESSYGLRPMALAYLKTGRLGKADEYAQKMIVIGQRSKQGGNLIYYGNFVLGIIAVSNGDIDGAGKYLLESVNFPPEMKISFPFCPDMELAGELLKKDKKDIVLEFLKKCGQYWNKTKCEEWIKQISDGKTPDFKNETMADSQAGNAKSDAAKPEAAKDNNGTADNAFTINLATAAAEKWLALIDDGKYQASWTEGAAYFKNAVTAAAFEQAMKTVRVPLGKLLSRKVKSAAYHTSLPGAPDGRYVVIQFETSFENKQSAIETVTPMADQDGQWRVSGYYIK